MKNVFKVLLESSDFSNSGYKPKNPVPKTQEEAGRRHEAERESRESHEKEMQEKYPAPKDLISESILNDFIKVNLPKETDSMSVQNKFNPPSAETAHSEALGNKDKAHNIAHTKDQNALTTGQKVDAKTLHQNAKLAGNAK